MQKKNSINPSIVTICVNYLNEEDTLLFVNDLINLKGYENGIVIIVVNKEASPLLRGFMEEKKVVIKYPDKNLGYFGGANWALQEYLQTAPLPEWIIISNTDIRFEDKDFFLKLKNYYTNKIDNIGIIAPDIELKSREGLPSSYKHQNPHMEYPPKRWKLNFLKLISKSYIFYIVFQIFSSLRYMILNKFFVRKLPNHPISIYAPFGAFIIFHKNYFEKGGNLNFKNFLFGEEIFVAETAKRLGLKIIYDPRLKVYHYEHGALKKLPSRKQFFYFRNAIDYILSNYK
ncbi:glycosyltransferase family 2 protein [Thermodesulfovibrio sp. TK110]